jgi:hypothetical protein
MVLVSNLRTPPSHETVESGRYSEAWADPFSIDCDAKASKVEKAPLASALTSKPLNPLKTANEAPAKRALTKMTSEYSTICANEVEGRVQI